MSPLTRSGLHSVLDFDLATRPKGDTRGGQGCVLYTKSYEFDAIWTKFGAGDFGPKSLKCFLPAFTFEAP